MCKLKDKYIAANCCCPQIGESITGYFSHDDIIKVHRSDCANLNKADLSRLVELNWDDIIEEEDFTPDDDFETLNEIDFLILKHHKDYGFDYSRKIASMYKLDKQAVFESHAKLREMKLLKRVEPRMIQYRKNIVKGKWIKHRNHTYYDVTDKGKKYLDYFTEQSKSEK
ncbi:MAG: DUF2250 domain-containing protein [candidate division Zixibacteria bacterium]